MVGVSVDWYTWLEQGRSITPSTQVLERLVQTLRLDANERTHLFLLAQQQATSGAFAGNRDRESSVTTFP